MKPRSKSRGARTARHRAGKNFRVPLPGRNLPREQAIEARGFADSFALRLRHHDEGLHGKGAPPEPIARACYDAIEQVRYEAIGATALCGDSRQSELGGGDAHRDRSDRARR